jgi:hypothetical protein
MSYIIDILNDENYYEEELKNHNYIENSLLSQKNSFHYKLFDYSNSALILSEYNDNKIIYTTPNFKRIILLSNESNDLTLNSLIPSNIEKFHNQLINEALFYSNIEQIFTTQISNILLKTKKNTLLNIKIFIKELPNILYGLVFIIHIERVLNDEFKIILDNEFKIIGYSDESNCLKKDNYESYLIPSFIGINICSVMPEILLYLTTNNNIENKDGVKEICLINQNINKRGNIYKYNIPSPNKNIIDKINNIINDIKKNDININEAISKIDEKQKIELNNENSKGINNSNFLEEKNIGEKYSELIAEIEENARKSIKIEYEIAERRLLNGKYKYYPIS